MDIISTLLLASGLQGKLVKTKFGQLWRSSIYQQFLFLFLSTGHEQNHKFEGVALRPLLSLDHQTLHRKKHQCTETDKSTLWDLGEEILGNGIWPIMALGNASSPFCRTKWFHVYVKIAFWLNDDSPSSWLLMIYCVSVSPNQTEVFQALWLELAGTVS